MYKTEQSPFVCVAAIESAGADTRNKGVCGCGTAAWNRTLPHWLTRYAHLYSARMSCLPSFYGSVCSEQDAEVVFTRGKTRACTLVDRRLDPGRDGIYPGAGYVYHMTSSGIKRWTDGLLW